MLDTSTASLYAATGLALLVYTLERGFAMPIASKLSAAKATASVFGALSGIGGLVHGVGEVLQGGVKVDGVIVNSWTSGPIADHMGGEPGMTLIPDVRLSGILTLVISAAIILWSLAFLRKRRDGAVLVLLSTGMLLVGGGFGPPIIGILAGLSGLGLGEREPSRITRHAGLVTRSLARMWPWVYGVGVANGVFLVIGSYVAAYTVDADTSDLFLKSFFGQVLALLLVVPASFAYDSQRAIPAERALERGSLAYG